MMKGQSAKITLSAQEQELWDRYQDVRAIMRYREPMARLPYIVDVK